MGCFDYDEVECCICEERTVDAYVEFKGKIVCDGCREGMNKRVEDAGKCHLD